MGFLEDMKLIERTYELVEQGYSREKAFEKAVSETKESFSDFRN